MTEQFCLATIHTMKTSILVSALLAVHSASLADDWPQWRGPARSDVSNEKDLLRHWTQEPKRLWLFENAGHGYSGPAIAGGKLFTMGTRNGSEVLLALDTRTGKELWTASIGEVYSNNWGDGPRGTPAVDGDHVYALGGQGALICARTADGQVVWRTTMQQFGGKTPGWGYTESVLVDGDKVVCTPGGSRGALVALDKKNGKLIWQSKEFTADAHYSSIVPAEINGARQYIQLTERALVGIDAANGKLLWETDFPGRTAVIPTPIHRDGYVYVTAGYSAGCKLVKIGPGNKVHEIYQNRVMKNHHGGVVLIGDHVYGHSDGAGWVCQEFLTGKEVWNERRKLGKGAMSAADGMLYCLDEGSGVVALVEASPSGWREHGRFRLEPQSAIRSRSGRIWTHPVIANGKLFLRDQEFIYCYDIAEKQTAFRAQ